MSGRSAVVNGRRDSTNVAMERGIRLRNQQAKAEDNDNEAVVPAKRQSTWGALGLRLSERVAKTCGRGMPGAAPSCFSRAFLVANTVDALCHRPRRWAAFWISSLIVELGRFGRSCEDF